MSSTHTPGAITPEFLALFSARYISVTTYRKNGATVVTPVWASESNGAIYVETGADAGKVKRIRNNPHVLLAPCNARGVVSGTAVEGLARVVETAAEEFIAKGALQRKYGIQRQLFSFAMTLVQLIRRKPEQKSIFLAIEPHTHLHNHH